MALNTNLHVIAGSLGKDPEVKFTSNGNCICELSIATSHWDSQEEDNVTDWHRVIVIGRQAQYIADYAKKGSEITATGRVQTRKWQDRYGQDRYITETICFDAQLTRANKQDNPQQQARPSNKPNEYRQQSGGRAAPTDHYEDPEGDIPF